MRLAALVLCVVGLSIGVNGQGRPPAEARWKTGTSTVHSDSRRLPNGVIEGHNSLTATNVEIHIGNSIIMADAAEVADWAGAPGPTEIVLTGTVRVRTVLEPTPLP